GLGERRALALGSGADTAVRARGEVLLDGLAEVRAAPDDVTLGGLARGALSEREDPTAGCFREAHGGGVFRRGHQRARDCAGLGVQRSSYSQNGSPRRVHLPWVTVGVRAPARSARALSSPSWSMQLN